jgi:anaerobic dimethyl sulfoxide reductase subunit C (anchor subunit)
VNTREWALVAFTLLMQTSVGLLAFGFVLQIAGPRPASQPSGRLVDLPLALAGAAAVAGLLASLLHLGSPTQAWLAITNVRTSWLSREVLLAVLFVATGAAFVTFGSNDRLRLIFGGAALLLGAALVYAMARLYMVPAQLAWNHITTPVSFFVTTLVVGAVFTITLPAAMGAVGPTAGAAGVGAVRWLVFVAIALVALHVLLLPVQLASLVGEPAAATSVGASRSIGLAVGSAICALVAAVLLAGGLRSTSAPALSCGASRAALVLVLLSIVLGRVLFYASSVRLGRL